MPEDNRPMRFEVEVTLAEICSDGEEWKLATEAESSAARSLVVWAGVGHRVILIGSTFTLQTDDSELASHTFSKLTEFLERPIRAGSAQVVRRETGQRHEPSAGAAPEHGREHGRIQ